MNIVDRVKRFCLLPDSAWSTIASERAEAPALITGDVGQIGAVDVAAMVP